MSSISFPALQYFINTNSIHKRNTITPYCHHQLSPTSTCTNSFFLFPFSAFSSLLSKATAATTTTAAREVELGLVRVGSKEKRMREVVRRAGGGGPGTTAYLFAFAFPMTLLLITIFTSIRIADNLDQKYMEELAINEAILEEEEEDDDDDDGEDDEDKSEGKYVLPEKEPALPQPRNRPRRQA